MSAPPGPLTTVVVPCFDDWPSLHHVLEEIDECFAVSHRANVIVVDDGSSSGMPDSLKTINFSHLDGLEILVLGTNMGHQRALCVGLSAALDDPACQRIVLMDSDGEDDPSDLATLADSMDSRPASAVVAQRGRRTEGPVFRFFNALFRVLFRSFTGQRLDFGNFMMLDRTTATRLAYTPDTWNNVPTSLMRSRAAIRRIPIDRGTRYDGQSKLGFVGLVNHGLGAISTYVDVVFARLIVVASIAFGATILVGLVALGVRLSTGQPLPGWFALGTTALAIASLLVLIFLTLLTFVMLAQRRQGSAPPIASGPQFVIERIRILPLENGPASS